METKIEARRANGASSPQSLVPSPPRAFTLVELLVVITIIGILVALISVAAAGALKTARFTEIKVEVDQISMAMETYLNTAGSYPPNCQTDGSGASNPIDESQVLSDFKRHLRQAFPRHREPDSLLRLLLGQTVAGSKELPGGMTAGEAVVFWLGGFSPDPKYPISGDGGPSYALPTVSGDAGQDQLQDRTWTFPFEIARLGPRDETTGYFDGSTERFIEFPDPRIPGPLRRINFWQYTPSKSPEPYLYFDTSRHAPEPMFDPPAATEDTGIELHVHAIKEVSESGSSVVPIQFANNKKFQILHCGTDDEWGEAFELMTLHNGLLFDDLLLYPTGPFVGDVADTITNFSSSTLEKSQP